MANKNIVIVESPAKAKTIAKFLGKDYEVKSSYGHVRDLPKKGIGVDMAHGFKPTYEVSPDKLKIVSDLKKASKGSIVWLASDEDREGEAIAWHLSEVLELDPKKTKRIVFHEITKPAIEAAVEKPREIDMALVHAQQARRILDRLVGYELSPVLWKKVKPGLSAGRVQSVAVRLIVEREREIRDFKPVGSFKVTGLFDVKGSQLTAELSDKLATEVKAKDFLTDSKTAKFTVKSVDQKPGKRNPGPPFTTSTLQQEAARKLGYSVRQTMSLAQRLYENGHITYMRTDSNNLSELAISAAEKYIVKTYGKEYSRPQRYTTKSASAQEAHEAIRPTNPSKTIAGADAQQKKIYQLIWQRTLASQMAPAAVEKTEIHITNSKRPEVMVGSGEVISFDGFFKVYGGGKDDVILPQVSVGQELKRDLLTATEVFSKAGARYGEAALVRKLEELGIGRPSTYAPTISTIQDRGYIEKKDLDGEQRDIQVLTLKGSDLKVETQTVTVGADRSKLVPTPLAEIVTDFLTKHFTSIVDYDFTANAEQGFDDVADKKETWQELLKKFYDQFHPLVKDSESVSRAETSQERILGKDPASGKTVLVRFGRYGPVLQLGQVKEGEEDKDAPKPSYAPLPDDVTMENVTLEQALPMFNLPRVVGTTLKGQEITADIGRFGPYVKVDKMFVSIKDHDPFTISEKVARELITGKIKTEAERNIADFGKIKVLQGPYGPYVTDGKKNARIDKEIDPKKLDQAAAEALLAAAPEKKGRFNRRANGKGVAKKA